MGIVNVGAFSLQFVGLHHQALNYSGGQLINPSKVMPQINGNTTGEQTGGFELRSESSALGQSAGRGGGLTRDGLQRQLGFA